MTGSPQAVAPRILFVDHEFHRRTRSTQFFLDLLPAESTRALYCAPQADLLPLLREHPCEALVFMQLQPKPRLLRALAHPNVTWVPMRDDFDADSRRVRQTRGSGLKFVNFCRQTHDVIHARGQPSLGVRYWPEPRPAPPRHARTHPRVYLWDRGQVQWPLLKRLLGEQPVDSVVLRLSADPGHRAVRPDADDVRRYRIQVVEDWLARDDYLALVAGCDVFVAPRWLEGIGMAMLEALAAGQPVIAPDRPTMNEYVHEGRNGWLYDPACPRPLDLSGWRERGRSAWQDCVDGAARWAIERRAIAPFVLSPSTRRDRWWWRLAARLGR